MAAVHHSTISIYENILAKPPICEESWCKVQSVNPAFSNSKDVWWHIATYATSLKAYHTDPVSGGIGGNYTVNDYIDQRPALQTICWR